MSGEGQHDRPQLVYEDMLDGLPIGRQLQVAGQAPAEIALRLDGFGGPATPPTSVCRPASR